jgi:hypothetical protein
VVNTQPKGQRDGRPEAVKRETTELRVRAWQRLKFLNPEKILRGLRAIEVSHDLDQLPIDVAQLRTRDLRTYGEGRQAALLCYGLSQMLGARVSFAQHAASDYDVVARYLLADVVHYVPVQLKELVPDTLNPRASLQAELDKISKYVDSKDLVVAVYLNTRRRLVFSDLKLPHGVVRELWFFGALSPDQSRWILLGNMLGPHAQALEFSYP